MGVTYGIYNVATRANVDEPELWRGQSGIDQFFTAMREEAIHYHSQCFPGIDDLVLFRPDLAGARAWQQRHDDPEGHVEELLVALEKDHDLWLYEVW